VASVSSHAQQLIRSNYTNGAVYGQSQRWRKIRYGIFCWEELFEDYLSHCHTGRMGLDACQGAKQQQCLFYLARARRNLTRLFIHWNRYYAGKNILQKMPSHLHCNYSSRKNLHFALAYPRADSVEFLLTDVVIARNRIWPNKHVSVKGRRVIGKH